MRHTPLALLLALVLPAGAPADEPVRLGVRAVALSPDGKLLAAGTGEPQERGAVTVWDVATREVRFAHPERTGVGGVAFSPDGKLLAVASYDNAARLLDAATGAVKATLRHPKEVRAVTFSPDGKRLATACWDRALHVWDVARGAETLTLTGHKDRIYSVAFSPDGKRLVSAGGEDGVKVWNAATGKEQRTLTPGRLYARCALISPDGRAVLGGAWDGAVRLWDADSGEQRARFSGMGGVDGLAFAPATHTLAVCSNGRDVALFDLCFRGPDEKERGRVKALLAKLEDDSYEVREAAGKDLLAMGFLIEPELRRASKESSSAEVRLRTRRLRSELLSQPRAQLQGHTREVEAAAFTPDGKLLATGSKDGTVRLWDVAGRKELAVLTPH
jgi:WD40 repeat protein